MTDITPSNTQHKAITAIREWFQFGTKSQLNIVDGYVMAPQGEGLCIDYDWDFIDKHTVAIL